MGLAPAILNTHHSRPAPLAGRESVALNRAADHSILTPRRRQILDVVCGDVSEELGGMHSEPFGNNAKRAQSDVLRSPLYAPVK
jgi:hypothetical protein